MLNCRLLTVDAFCYLCGCCCCLSLCTVVILLIFCAPKRPIFFETAFLFPWIELPFSLNRWIRSRSLQFLKPLSCRATQDPVLTNLGIIIQCSICPSKSVRIRYIGYHYCNVQWSHLCPLTLKVARWSFPGLMPPKFDH